MAKTTIKNSTLFYHDWLKAFQKMSDEDVGKITKALLLLDSEGVDTSFEENPILDIIYSQFSSTVERNREKYDASCQRKSEAAKKREAQKTTTSTTLHNCDDKSGVDKSGVDSDSDKKVSGVVSEWSGKDVPAAPPRTSLTTTTNEEIVTLWNEQSCTQDISSALFPEQRRNRTEMAVAIIGGFDRFLQLISGISEQAYFRDRDVDYDWFVDPKNFQSILEGKYKEPRKKKKEGWE